MSDKIIIVGGGIIGVATLYELSRNGLPTVLVEANDAVALGASFANAGLLTPSMSDPWNRPDAWKSLLNSFVSVNSPLNLNLSQLPKMVSWGARFLRNSIPSRYMASVSANVILSEYSTRYTEHLCREMKFDCDLSTNGSLKIYDSNSALTLALKTASVLEQWGIEFEFLDRDALYQREPELAYTRRALVGALFFPGDRILDAYQFANSLLEKSVDAGGYLKTGARVTELRQEGGKVVGVCLASGEYLAGDVVLAAGAHSPHLTNRLGFNLPIKPAKGYSLTCDLSKMDVEALSAAIVDDAKHCCIIPIGSRLRLVGGVEFAGMNDSIRKAYVIKLVSMFGDLFPRKTELVSIKDGIPWAGLRPMSADGRPIIGASPVPGLWLNCGHGHLGWTMATGSARVLTSQIMGNHPEIDVAPFSFTRT